MRSTSTLNREINLIFLFSVIKPLRATAFILAKKPAFKRKFTLNDTNNESKFVMYVPTYLQAEL